MSSSAALSPTSQEFMSILERQLNAQENQMAGQQQSQQQQSQQLFQQMQQMQQYQQMQQRQSQRQQQQQQQQQQQGRGMYGFDSFAQGQPQQLQQQQGGNNLSIPTTTTTATNPKDIPLTPEILNAFLQGLNSAGFSRQAISDFSAGQMGMVQGGQRQQSVQPQQPGRGFTASPVSTQSSSGGFVPSPQNGSDNNLMAMMMMMNNQIGGGNLINNNGNGLAGQQDVNLNPQNAYPQPGIHTPEASACSKDSVVGSNESSPEATTAPGGQGGMSSGQSPGESVNGGGGQMRAGTTRQLSGSSSLGGEGATSSSRRGSMVGQDRAGSMRAGLDKGEHKRKAEEEELLGHQSLRRHMGEEDSLSEDNSDHLAQGNSKRSGKKDASSRRKSSSGAAAAASREDSDVQAKALKRKNQNRAAQKAFRERREQRVKDLEDKVAELEANNAGQTFENDNLRQLLSKLQKENMALKESKFTFAMPVPGSQSGEKPTASAGPSRSTSQGGTPTGMGVEKLPTPPLSTIDDRSKSARNPAPHSVRSNTASSQFDSPQSTFSGSDAISPVSRPDTSAGDQVFFNPEPYNAFTNAGAAPNPVAGYTPFASAAEQVGAIGNVDLQALLDAFKVQYGQTGQTPAPAPAEPSPAPPQFNAYREVNSDDLLGDALGNDFDFDANVSIEDLFGNDEGMNEFLKSLNQPDMFNSAAAVEDVLPLNKSLIASNGSVSPVDASTETDPWASFYGNTNGLYKDANNASTNLPRNDSNLSGSVRPGSASGASADAAFSPSKYFAMSPDAVGTSSNDGVSPPSVINKASPCPYGTNISSMMEPPPPAYNLVTGERMLSTQEAWESVNHKIDLSNGFDLDDLCDSFKSKAQCNGSGPVISESEVNRIIDDYSKRKQMHLSP